LNVAPAIDGAGYTFCLQEIEGQGTRAVLRFAELKPRRAYKTRLYGGDARPLPAAGRVVRLSLAPRELATLRVVL
jgi:hypothetical protein